MDSLRIQGCQEEEKIDRKQGWNRILKLIYLSFETAESQMKRLEKIDFNMSDNEIYGINTVTF